MSVVAFLSNSIRDKSSSSKFRNGQVVRISSDVSELSKVLVAYSSIEAIRLARNLAGQLVPVISSENFVDDDGNLVTYYTIEDEFGYWFLLPEHLLEEKNGL